MEVRNLIKPSGTVVQITEIRAGDVYKRLQDSPYTDAKIVFGVVTDVLNNGEESSLVALEFVPVAYGNGEIAAVTKVFNGTSEIALFPATLDEYRLALAEAIEAQERIVDKAKAELLHKESILTRMVEQGEQSSLTEAKTLKILQ